MGISFVYYFLIDHIFHYTNRMQNFQIFIMDIPQFRFKLKVQLKISSLYIKYTALCYHYLSNTDSYLEKVFNYS